MHLPYPKAVITSVIFGALTLGTAQAQQWNALGQPGFSAGEAYAPIMALNAAGTPYVAYEDFSNAGKATVMTYGGTSWAPVGSPGITTNAAEFISIAISRYCVPYMVYTDEGASNTTSVMAYNGAWAPVGPQYITGPQTTYNDIAIDTFGTPYIVYVDGTDYFKATVKKFVDTASAWFTVGSADFTPGQASYCKLAISRGGTPYVAFEDADSNHRASVMAFDGLNWNFVGAQGFSEGRATYTDIVMDTNDVPYIVYADAGNGGKATVMKFNGTSWVAVGAQGFSDTHVQYTSIAIGANNLPYVAFSDGGTTAQGGPATVMQFDGATWSIMCAPGISAGIAGYTTVGVARQAGMVYVSYMDVADSSRATVMANNGVTPCYAASVATVAAGAAMSIYPNPAYDELNVVSAAEAIHDVKITNLLGQTVCSLQPNAMTAKVPVGNLPNGVYFIQVNSTDPGAGTIMKFVKE